MARTKVKAGDRVRWTHSQGSSTGKVVRRLTSKTKVKGHEAKATPEDPQYLVESDKTGAHAAHKPDALKKV